jgi:hypothetical protein
MFARTDAPHWTFDPERANARSRSAAIPLRWPPFEERGDAFEGVPRSPQRLDGVRGGLPGFVVVMPDDLFDGAKRRESCGVLTISMPPTRAAPSTAAING